MEQSKAVENSQRICWPGVITGFFLGAFLFWATIQLVVFFMFSRTAA